MDGDAKIIDFATAFSAPRSLLEGVPVYHTRELFRAIWARLRGEVDERYDRGPIELVLETYSIIRRPIITSTFRDPHDGKLYRVIIEPVIEGQNDEASIA